MLIEYRSVFCADTLLDFLNVVGNGLVHTVVQPVGVQQVCTGTPVYTGHPVGVIVGKIILWDLRIDTSSHITGVFLGQSITVIFRVTHQEYLTASVVLHGIYTGLGRSCQNFQPRNRLYILTGNGGVAGMGNPEIVIKSAEEDKVGILYRMLIYTRKLFRQ